MANSTVPNPDLATRMHELVRSGVDLQKNRISTTSSPFWAGLAKTGTRCWLDTGDMAAAEKSWSSEFSGLTTNNTLLNKEIQTGSYDTFIPEVAKLVTGLDSTQAVLEIAFALNARHGLRLVGRFGSWVSVELHTDLANDLERSVAYGIRYHAICPERFIVKIPMTPSGLIAARTLGERGIPVNLTLGFSARHNYLTTAVAKPRYVNVFLGRLNAYISDHKLGDPHLVGEKALWASQKVVRQLGAGRTLQIAASLREAVQLEALAGCDVITMPTPVAESGIKTLTGRWADQAAAVQGISVPKPESLRLSTLWDVSDQERALVDSLNKQPANSGAELSERMRSLGCADIFPRLSSEDQQNISKDGKIPKHERWASRIASGELAIDTLLNLAALASFTTDQAALDARIRKNMGR
jgi:transaldolase